MYPRHILSECAISTILNKGAPPVQSVGAGRVGLPVSTIHLNFHIMVTITDYALRTNTQGEEFFALILQGGVEMVKSKQTGKFYATSKKCSIPSTFDEKTCKAIIGQQMPGMINKVECEPYQITIQETGEILQMSYRWEYVSEAEKAEEAVFEGKVFDLKEA
jgi:hypothetical protein